MKSKIIIALLIAFSLIWIFSCGDFKEYKITYSGGRIGYDFHYTGRQTNNVIRVNGVGFTDPGYHLTGFFNEDGLQYFDESGHQLSGVLIEGDLHVYAGQAPNEYTISFNSGESGVFEDKITEKSVNTVFGEHMSVQVPSPSIFDEKYELDGYFDGDKRVTIGTELVEGYYYGYSHKEVINLTAKYKLKEYTVTLNFQDELIVPVELKVKHGEKIPDLTPYYKDNGVKDIVSWSVVSYAEMSLPEAVTSNIDIFAIWKEYKMVTLVYNTEVVKKFYEEPGKSTVLPNDVFEFYTVTGWYTSSTLSGNPINNIPYGALENKYYAMAELATYQIIFDTKTDIIMLEPMEYTYSVGCMLPILDGFDNNTFIGWADENGKMHTEITKYMSGDIYLYAVWGESTPITTAKELRKIAENPSGNYHLTCDIDFNKGQWSSVAEFTGVFDGRGYKISNMALRVQDSKYLGFVQQNHGIIKNVVFESATLEFITNVNASGAAIVASRNHEDGKIINCHATDAKISYVANAQNSSEGKRICIGTLVGYSYGLIYDCTADGKIEGSQWTDEGASSHAYVGGLVGLLAEKSVTFDCKSYVDIELDNTAIYRAVSYGVGGFTGWIQDNSCVSRCYAQSSIKTYYLSSLFDNNSTNIMHENQRVGVFVGVMRDGTKEECCSYGSIYATYNDSYISSPVAGGFIGAVDGNYEGNIYNCYSNAIITAEGENVGMFAGSLGSGADLVNCYADSKAGALSSNVSAFVGSAYGEIKNSFTTFYGNLANIGYGEFINCVGIENYTREELFSEGVFFDKLLFDRSVWKLNEDGIAVLAWQLENEA